MANPSLSRSGQTHVDGKLTAHVHIVLSEEARDDLTGVAFAHNMSTSEYARHVLESHLYGAKASVQRRIAGAVPLADAMKVRATEKGDV